MDESSDERTFPVNATRGEKLTHLQKRTSGLGWSATSYRKALVIERILHYGLGLRLGSVSQWLLTSRCRRGQERREVRAIGSSFVKIEAIHAEGDVTYTVSESIKGQASDVQCVENRVVRLMTLHEEHHVLLRLLTAA